MTPDAVLMNAKHTLKWWMQAIELCEFANEWVLIAFFSQRCSGRLLCACVQLAVERGKLRSGRLLRTLRYSYICACSFLQ